MLREAPSFKVKSELTDDEFEVTEIHDIRETQMQDGTTSHHVHAKVLRLADGRSIAPTDEKMDTFVIPGTDEVFRRIE